MHNIQSAIVCFMKKLDIFYGSIVIYSIDVLRVNKSDILEFSCSKSMYCTCSVNFHEECTNILNSSCIHLF